MELKGIAAGISQGGIVQFITHELEIECPAMAIPEKIVLNISELALGKAIHAKEVPLPEGAVLTSAPEVDCGSVRHAASGRRRPALALEMSLR